MIVDNFPTDWNRLSLEVRGLGLDIGVKKATLQSNSFVFSSLSGQQLQKEIVAFSKNFIGHAMVGYCRYVHFPKTFE